jgi:hypothetical protein
MNHYEDRIVAFIDILAFSEMIRITDTNDENKQEEATLMLIKLQNVIRFLQSGITKAISNKKLPSGTRASMFSDSIVISIPKAESRGVWTLFKLLKELQIRLIFQNILLRGGVVHGKLIHENQLIIGPALINAYEVESKSALYPRIVIDPNVLRLYERKGGISIMKLRIEDRDDGKTIAHDLDGTSFIDYFNSVDPYITEDVRTYFIALNEMIRKGLNRKYGTGIRMKYMWMKEKVINSSYPNEIKSKPIKMIRTK